MLWCDVQLEARRLRLALPRTIAQADEGPMLLPLSALSAVHLQHFARDLAAYLRQLPDVRLADVCGTMALRRTRFLYRKGFVASTTEQLAAKVWLARRQRQQLRRWHVTWSCAVLAAGGVRQVGREGAARRGRCQERARGFVLTGQGAQWPKNGQDLMKTFPVYKNTVQVQLASQLVSTRAVYGG
jgi:acyl transferase domain-containing protein